MFDPERDEDPGPRRFYLRLLAVVVISAAGCVALWPSVSGFGAGPGHNTGCVAIADGWQKPRTAPDTANLPFPPPPMPKQLQDPAAMARWRTEWQAAQARPEVQAANDFLAWKDGPGRVRESRHRLLVSAIGLASVAALSIGTGLVLRTRTNLRRAPAVVAGT